MVSTPCQACNAGSLMPTRQGRGGFLAAFGWILLIASIVGTIAFSIGTIAMFTASDELLQKFVDVGLRGATKASVDSLHAEVEAYRRKHGALPEDLEVLTRPDPMHGDRPWARPQELLDPWNRALVLRKSSDTEFEIVSLGPPDASAPDQRDDPAASAAEISSARPVSMDPSEAATDSSQNRQLAAVARGTTVVLLIVAIAGVVVGWLLVRKRTVHVCDHCGTVVPAA